MAHGAYYYIAKAWKKPDAETLRKRMIDWRASEVLTRVDKPLRIDRARTLGYKDKKGFVVIRVRINRGGHKKTRPIRGRRTKRMTKRLTLKMNYRWIAEQKVERSFTNLVALNSYLIGQDGVHYFYEVIAVDPEMPEIKNDPTISWICKKKNQKRAMRGLTSAAKKARGLRNKNPTNKMRPSRTTNRS